jgi:molybdopterin synthase sulfur carrier subunit
MSTSITITVKLFAAYQEAYDLPELKLELPPNSSVEFVLNSLINEHPELEKWHHSTRFGVNFQFVAADTPLHDGDEVVLIPPVSGG